MTASMWGRAALALLLLTLGPGGVARAQAKPPDAKLPELKLPEAKLPEGKLPEGEAQPLGDSELPPELAALLAGSSGLRVEEKEPDAPLTIQELVNPQVKTASSRSESARDAPARVLTFSAQELKARGYQELTELLDDLPGMDTIHAWGDTYFKSYWRGYRSDMGEPFLLLVDGMEFNHLWLGTAQLLAALPLSNVEQVEVLYGPASARYGPNAAMGVINVITRQDERSGSGVRTHLAVRSPERALTQRRVGDMTKVGDVSAYYVGQGFRVRLTGRFDLGVLDPALNERFEWLKDEYFTDRRLWGDFVEYPSLAGSFRSPNEKQAVDARLILENRDAEGLLRGETEVAAQLYRTLTGYGLIYPADKLQSRAPWVMLEQSLTLRHEQRLSSVLSSSTRLRYRRSRIDSPTTVLGRVEDSDGSAVVVLSYLQNASSGFSVGQDFTLAAGTGLALPSDELQLDFGLEYERRTLDQDFGFSGNVWDPATPFKDYVFPQPVTAGERMESQSELDAIGVYLLPRYRFLETQTLHLGLRLDYNNFFSKVEATFRGGYVGQFLDRDLTVKVFYGQAIEEPGRQRQSFEWDDWRTDAERPGRSGTLDVGLDYSWQWLVLHGTAYYVHAQDSLGGGEQLLRRMAGVDVGATAVLELEGIRQLRLWGYYSPYLLARQTEDPKVPERLVPVGDLAWHKLLLGATLEANRFLSLTALGRCLSERTPPPSPVGSTLVRETLPGYCVVDANFRVRHLFVDGLSLSLRGTNLLDTKYSHPGLHSADSGNTPGRWDGNRWIGSQGDYNSYMPQPGRAVSLQLALEL